MKNPRYKIFPVKYSVCLEKDSPILGESVTEISVDDEAGGPFLVLSQEEGRIKLDFAELPYIMEAIELLKSKFS